ncbi:hypothetical protein [Dyadobacter psychrotolerans]|uniref:Uncharacterized protein n=1 Tax=Dyadobacter psychrotolerans TaxID=2541721 RepID=A0A4R5E1T0_9BACT|nr:hypothetical protein [Dyadobacter psychrotolerans]TDE18055.1 hypothetical protein E0F88_00430 [Dyadobacter psychrotolerans]
MKKLKFEFLFAAAVMLSGGLAVANSLTAVAPNVYNADNSGGTDWTPVPSDKAVECDAAPTHECSGTQTGTGVTDIERGDARLIDKP